MRKGTRRLAAWLMALVLTMALVPGEGRAVLSGVYLTAVNEKVMLLSDETMPFWSKGVLYVSSAMFEGTDLGVSYVRNTTMDLAVLYTPRTDLRFDLKNKTVYDKQGVSYEGRAIQRGGSVFFPLVLVCGYFGLNWSYSETETVPLIRVTSASAVLPVDEFINAAAPTMLSYYNAYEKLVKELQAQHPHDPPPVAVEGQKLFLLVESTTAADTGAVLEKLTGDQATFLLTAEQMEDGDLLRGLVAGGHAVALRVLSETEDAAEEEIQRGRALLWQAACSWLELVSYRGEADFAELFASMGCRQVAARLDGTERMAEGDGGALLQEIGRYREDLGVLLGSDAGCLAALDALLEGLRTARYNICAWRLTSWSP